MTHRVAAVITLALGMVSCRVDEAVDPEKSMHMPVAQPAQRDEQDIERYEADVTIVTETDNTRRYGIPPGHGSRFHLGRFRDDAGNWWTSVELPARANMRGRRGEPPREVTRFEMQDGGALGRTFYSTGELAREFRPSHQRPPSDGHMATLATHVRSMAQPRPDATSFDQIVVTPTSAARLRARLERVASKVQGGTSQRLIRTQGDESVEIVLDAAGAVAEEVTRVRGNVVQRVAHEYVKGDQGLLVRARSRLERPANDTRGPVSIETRFENTRVRMRGGTDE